MARRLIAFFASFALVFLLLPRAHADTDAPQRIVAGTTLIADIVHDLLPQAEVRTLIPGGACPGHYDIRPGDVRLLRDADAIYLHAWQTAQPHITTLLDAAQTQRQPVALPDAGNALLPENNLLLTRHIAAELAELFPQHKRDISARAAARRRAVTTTAQALKTRLAASGVAEMRVVCAAMQEPLAHWAGCKVVTAFPRPASMTPQQMAKVIAAGRGAGVRLVLDNLQSGDGGHGLAEALGARRVILSNFPGGFADTPTWEATMRDNVRRLLEAAPAMTDAEAAQ